MKDEVLTPELVLQAYAAGIFPMAEGREDDRIFWVDPRKRGVLPLDGFHVSRSLRRRILRENFTITYDRAFEGVVDGCAARDETWINETIRQIYLDLFRRGRAHSIEVWDGDDLVGGVYGVTLGCAFFGESMFSRRTDASKIALFYLVDHVARQGFRMFDTQFITPHLASLGGIEISRLDYQKMLADALQQSVEFNSDAAIPGAQEILQRMTQTS